MGSYQSRLRYSSVAYEALENARDKEHTFHGPRVRGAILAYVEGRLDAVEVIHLCTPLEACEFQKLARDAYRRWVGEHEHLYRCNPRICQFPDENMHLPGCIYCVPLPDHIIGVSSGRSRPHRRSNAGRQSETGNTNPSYTVEKPDGGEDNVRSQPVRPIANAPHNTGANRNRSLGRPAQKSSNRQGAPPADGFRGQSNAGRGGAAANPIRGNAAQRSQDQSNTRAGPPPQAPRAADPSASRVELPASPAGGRTGPSTRAQLAPVMDPRPGQFNTRDDIANSGRNIPVVRLPGSGLGIRIPRQGPKAAREGPTQSMAPFKPLAKGPGDTSRRPAPKKTSSMVDPPAAPVKPLAKTPAESTRRRQASDKTPRATDPPIAPGKNTTQASTSAAPRRSRGQSMQATTEQFDKTMSSVKSALNRTPKTSTRQPPVVATARREAPHASTSKPTPTPMPTPRATARPPRDSNHLNAVRDATNRANAASEAINVYGTHRRRTPSPESDGRGTSPEPEDYDPNLIGEFDDSDLVRTGAEDYDPDMISDLDPEYYL